MPDLISQAAAIDFEARAIMPARELGAYEALWAREGASFKSLAELFRSQPGSVPSDFPSAPEAISSASILPVKVIKAAALADIIRKPVAAS
jgi:DNA processing protein